MGSVSKAMLVVWLTLHLLLFLGAPIGVQGLSIYALCQSTTGKLFNPTFGCPPGTLFVSQTDKRADFKTVSQAVLSLPDNTSPRWVLVGEGTYLDAVNVTRKGPLTIMGQTNHPESYQHNLVTVYNTTFINQKTQNASVLDNADSQVLTVAPNKYSVWTGAGYYGGTPLPIPIEYGCTDFRSYNINWENRAANASVGPALALGVGFANASFYGCTFRSWQDTIFIGKNASVLFKKSQILGQTDYIYGFGTAYFSECTLGSRGPGCLTAWKGTPNYTNAYGAYFSKSRVVRSPEALSQNLTGTQCLGRPWNNASRVIYLDTYMDQSVLPAGFTIWSPTDPRNGSLLTYGEYGSYGPGYNRSTRVPFDQQLIAQQASKYSVQGIFGGWPKWVDYVY